MNDVNELLRWAVETEMPQPGGLERVRRAVQHRRRRVRIGSGIVAALVTLAGLAFAIETFGRDAREEQRPSDDRLSSEPLDVSNLEPGWSAEIPEGSWLFGVHQDSSRVFVPTSSGVVAFPKDCADPCTPLWTLNVPSGGSPLEHTELAVGDGIVAAATRGTLVVVESDCRTDGEACGPLWRAEPPGGSGGYVSPLIDDGVVRVMSGVGSMPDYRVSAAAFPIRCRTGGGECAPLWTADLGRGTLYSPGTALNGVFYQQVGAVMSGFRADCGTGGARCEPDFAIEALGDQSTQAGSLYGPVGLGGELVVSSGDGNLYAYREHCGSSCSPLWVGPVADFLDSSPQLAGNLVVVSTEEGLTAFALGCGSRGERCEPRWTAPLEDYATVAYADPRVVVVADHFSDGGIIAFPTDCPAQCAPLWSAPVNGDVYGVVSDGKTVFAGLPGELIRGYPIGCSDPCSPVWEEQARGDVWWILLDGERLIAAGRVGEQITTGVVLTAFE
jgi:hypothetical protein